MSPTKSEFDKRVTDKHISIVEGKIDDLTDVINPLNGKGGLVNIIEKLKIQVSILWIAAGTFCIYIIADFFSKRRGL